MLSPRTALVPLHLRAALAVALLIALSACQKATSPAPGSDPSGDGASDARPVAGGATRRAPPARGELFLAVRELDVARTRALLERGADPNENVGTEEAPLTPLWLATAIAVQDPHDVRALQLATALRRRGASPFIEYEGFSAIDLAVEAQNDPLLTSLLSRIGKSE